MLSRLTTQIRKVGRTDQRLVRRSAILPHTPADRALMLLTRSANRGMLWFVVSAILAARKGETRRAAWRGVAAISTASASANLVAKRLFPRRRPAAELLPLHRRLVNRPTSSSFPSGHAASAVAFTTALAMECPTAGAAVAPVAAAVAYSRVHTGVHWPSDVGAGAMIGVGAALATLHWWPLHPDVPTRTTHHTSAPVIRDGEDLIAVVNPHSGDRGVDPTELVREAWPKATVLYPNPAIDLVTQLARAIDESDRAVRALGVAGGDGTVAAVASVAADRGLPLALIPAGTLNHFARDLVVESMLASDKATEAGAAIGVDLANVEVDLGEQGADRDLRWFVNTASLGGYPEMVELRERLEERLPKWPAAAIAMVRTLRRTEPFRVRLNDEPALVWMIFVGNGSYTPKGFAPTCRPAMDTGLLDVRYLRADLPYSRARFVLATLTRTLSVSHVYRQQDMPALRVELPDAPKRIAVDGEVGQFGRRFVFSSRPSALTVYRE